MKITYATWAASVAAMLAVCLASPAWASSSSEPTRISLPSGPGSIHGLGRSFQASPASGTSSYGVDVEVPPGAGGFDPHVALEYDSGGAVSDAGMGWRIGGVPALRRRIEDGLPLFDASDTFELDGFGTPSKLLEVSPGVYRSEFESGSFVRVQRASDGRSWEARAKGGVTYRFGGALESEGDHVATYLLREAVDVYGHRIAYEWDTSDGHGSLTSITWNDFAADVRNVVSFRYEQRPDTHVLFSAGIRQAFLKRLVAIEVTHGGSLVRRYELAYAKDVHSRLASVVLVGRDGVSRQPALTLGYTALGLSTSGTIVAMSTPPGRSPGDPDVELADLNGDTLPDLLVTRPGAFRSYINQDGRAWLPGADWAAADSPSVQLGAAGVQLADLDGDGAIDLVVKSGVSSFRYFPALNATSFRPPVAIATAPNFTFEDPDVRLADMDADRRIDVVVTTSAGLAIGYNKSGVDWTVPRVVGSGPVDARQALRFSDGGHTQLCDVNGDRVQDLCYLTPGSLAYWLGRGRGAFEASQLASGVPNYDPSNPWELHDIDGDGWVDLVHVGVNQVEISLATGAGRFSPPTTISGTPTRGPNTTVRFADMNGSGSADIVWVDVSGDATQAWRYLELFPTGRAGLLARVDNGLGHVTSIVYGTAAEDAADARTDGTPWTARMNAGMAVVRRVEMNEGLGDPAVSIEYRYRDGTWSPIERTFAGFAGSVERALGDAFTPSLVTESTYDVGLADRTLRGHILSSAARDESGYRFSRTRATYRARDVGAALDGSPIHFTFKDSEERFAIEGTDESLAGTTLMEWDVDAFGNLLVERQWGETVGNDRLAGHDEAITLRTFANNERDWLLGYVATEELQDGLGQRVRMKRLYYDGADFVGLPVGQVVRGTPTRHEEWVGPALDAFELEGALRSDAEGHPLETKDARGGGHVFEWDAHDRTTLLSESAKLDGGAKLTARVDFDRALGSVLRVTAYSGEATACTYDAFGRLLTVVKPGDSPERPTLAVRYDAGAPLSRVTTQRRVWSGRDDVETIEDVFDGAGRLRARMTAAESGRWMLGSVGFYDARGNVRRSLRDRVIGASEHGAPPLRVDGAGTDTWRDALGRVVRGRSQLGTETRTSFEPFATKHWDGAQNDARTPYEHTPTIDTHDGLGRVVTHAAFLEGKLLQASYAYDAAGSLLSKTDPENHASRYAYDGRGRRVLVDDPDAGRHAFVYDATGSLLEHRRVGGATTRFTYDLAGRALTADWDGDGTAEVTRVWDVSDRSPTSALARGLLTKTTDPSGSTEVEYDERRRITKVHRVIDGHAYDVASAYDAQDREYWHAYPDGSSIRLDRNALGQLVGVGGKAFQFDYDDDGLEHARATNTGVREEHVYDDDRRLIEVRAATRDGAVLHDLKWVLDPASNILAVGDARPNISSERDRSETYTYDNLYRLTATKGLWGAASWAYSSSGNVTKRASSVAALNVDSLAYGGGAGPHALTKLGSRAVRYDVLGRVLDDGERAYTWDGADHLVHVASRNGASAESIFDADGARRIRRERSADAALHTTYFVDDSCEVRDGQLVRFITHGGKRIAKLSSSNGVTTAAGATEGESDGEPPGSGNRLATLAREVPSAALAFTVLLVLGVQHRRRLVHVAAFAAPLLCIALAMGGCSSGASNGPPPLLNGTITSLSDADDLLFDDAIGSLAEQTSGTGAARATFAAFPYGVARYDTSSETLKFAGTPRDVGVGLDQMGARAYAPDLGAWTSADPEAVERPERGLGASFAANNAYSYAGDAPVVGVDRDGHFVFLVIAAIVIGSLITSQYANAPETQATPLQHKDTADLALDTAHNSAMVYGAASFGAGAATTVAREGVMGAVKVTSSVVQGTIAGTAVHHVADAADPSGKLGEVLDIAMVVQSSIPSAGASGRFGPGPDVATKYKPGWTSGQRAAADAKIASLNKMAAEGRAVKTQPQRAPQSASARFKKSGGSVPKGTDVDHTEDLQLGGADTTSNMKPLDSSVNRSLGVQIANGLRPLPVGAPVGGFSIGN